MSQGNGPHENVTSSPQFGRIRGAYCEGQAQGLDRKGAMPMKNRPEISEDGTQRVICAANGLWRLQNATGFEHERGRVDGSNRECLAWDNQGPAMEYTKAKKAANHELSER